MPITNENRAESARENRRRRAAVIVTPDRDTPGAGAAPCVTPTNATSRSLMSEVSRSVAHTRSTTPRTRPKLISRPAARTGPRSADSSEDATTGPATMTGSVARVTRTNWRPGALQRPSHRPYLDTSATPADSMPGPVTPEDEEQRHGRADVQANVERAHAGRGAKGDRNQDKMRLTRSAGTQSGPAPLRGRWPSRTLP